MPISPPSSREEFKISIICALTLEAKAVLPLFDSKYDENLDKYRRVPGDTNAYTLGNIGKYHVVLAHMPGPGKGFASSVASNVKRSYPCIELALVVGICGGVPHVRDSMSLQDDIFLGDVIVSNGVVQYDLGRRIPGDFVRKNTVHANLGRPSPEILSFLNKLDVGYDQLTHRLASYLVLVQEKFPSGYPGLEKDLLFSPDYEHERDNCKCTEVACCDDTVIVRRRDNTQNEHTTLVHFGLVASGDTVMMSAHDRERISEEENIIAFEMEGAGVWDNLPCIVIKGVSDYADSHKTKGWQRFAAASAAACMRAVLDEIPVPLPISSAGPSNTTELSESISQEDLQEDLEFYLGTLTFPRDELRVDEISSAHEKTCEWMMRHPEYLKWTSHVELPIHGGFFWIKGKPGAGKSTMMKYLLSKTERMLGDTVILSFFFYAQGTFLERSIIGMYRSLLHQLLLSERISENSMKRFWKLAKSLGSPKDEIEWTKRDVKGLLSLTIKSLKGCQIVILIDAVDECDQKEVEDMISFFQELGKSAIEHAVNMRVCLASRHYPRISLEKGIDLILEDEQEHENDLKKYVQTKLKVSSSKQAQEIRDTIIKRAAGVFLWVMLVIRLLNRAFDKGEIDTMKERLNQIPDELDDLFTDILTREQEDKEALIFSLQLLLFGFERLVTDEFYFALLFQKSGTAEEDIDLELHSLGFMSRRILDVTKGLTENITTKNSRVRFIHESVRDFLLKRNGFARILSEKLDPQRFIGCSHSRLAEFCFDYVSAVNRSQPGHKQAKLSSCFDCVSAANHPRPWHELQIEKTFGIELEPTRPPCDSKFAFFRYAMTYILEHSNSAQAGGVSQKKLLGDFLNRLSPSSKTIRISCEILPGLQEYSDSLLLLYILVERDLHYLIPLCIAIPGTPSVWDPNIKACVLMETACCKGYMGSIRALLGLEMDISSSVMGSSVDLELISGMRRFLEIQQQRQNSLDMILVKSALTTNNVEMLRLLFRTKAVDLNDMIESLEINPLLWAIRNYDSAMLEFLIFEATVNVNGRDKEGRTPLSCVAGSISPSIIPDSSWILSQTFAVNALLKTNRVHINTKDNKLWSPLAWAIKESNVEVAEILINIETLDVNSKNLNGHTPLIMAIIYERPTIVEMLLRCGRVDINSQDFDGRTALSWASAPCAFVQDSEWFVSSIFRARKEWIQVAILEALLEYEPNVMLVDNWGHPSTWWAQAYIIILQAIDLGSSHGFSTSLLERLLTNSASRGIGLVPADPKIVEMEMQLFWTGEWVMRGPSVHWIYNASPFLFLVSSTDRWQGIHFHVPSCESQCNGGSLEFASTCPLSSNSRTTSS